MIENVTSLLNEELAKHYDIQSALRLIASCDLFSRETKSAALGEISEHLIARMVNGRRRPSGSRGFDVVDAHDSMIEVKSRLTGKWGEKFMFDFSLHTKGASRVYCVAWDDKTNVASISEAYTIPVSLLVLNWGGTKLKNHSARTTLKKIRQAWEADCRP